MERNDRTLRGLLRKLEHEIERGVTSGSQIYVAVGGEVILDAAVGRRRPGDRMRRSTMHNLYCGLKPVSAIALAAGFEEAQIDVESTLVRDLIRADSAVSADPSVGSGVTLGDVLAHDAGLGEPRLIGYLLDDQARVQELLGVADILVRATRGVPAYSEVSAWVLLAAAYQSVSGHDFRELFAAHTGSMGGELSIEVRSPADRRALGFYFDMSARPPIPLLHDRTDRFACNDRPGVAMGYASMRGLGRWYQQLLECRSGREVPGFPSPAEVVRWTNTHRALRHDRVLGRPASFGWGFLTDLQSHGFGEHPSPRAFGSVGFMANSFAFADPDHDLVVACFTNGLCPDPRYQAEVTRPERVATIYDSIGLA